MLMSSRIRSGGSRRAARRASLPPGTGRTLYTRSLSIPASTCRLAGVSSTPRMLAEWPTARLRSSGFNGGPPAEEVEKLLILEPFGQAAQPASGTGIAGFDLTDLGQQQVQVGRDD